MIKRLWAGAHRMVGFGSGILLLAAASLLMIPALIDSGGLQAWTSIVIGQAIGSIAATVVGYGYGVTGPAMIVAAGGIYGQRSEFLGSLFTRGVVLVPVLAATMLLVHVIPNPFPWLGFTASLPVIFGGLTATFVYVGRSQPYRLLLLEMIPRFGFSMLGVWRLIDGASVFEGLAWQLAGVLVAVVGSAIAILSPPRGAPPRRLAPRRIRESLSEQWHALASTLLVALYGGLPVIVVGFVAPPLVAVFGIYHKLKQQLVVAASSASLVVQGWVPRRLRAGASAGRTIASALTAMTALAILIVLGLVLFGGSLIGWLGAGQVQAEPVDVLLLGLLVGASLVQSCLSYACLVPLGGIRTVMRVNVIGVVVGLGLLFVLAPAGVGGALVALLIGVVAQIIALSAALLRRLGRARRG